MFSELIRLLGGTSVVAGLLTSGLSCLAGTGCASTFSQDIKGRGEWYVHFDTDTTVGFGTKADKNFEGTEASSGFTGKIESNEGQE